MAPFAVVGWWDGAGWVPADGTQPVPVSGGEEYQIVRLAGEIFALRGSRAERSCETDPGTSTVVIQGLEGDDSGPGPVGVWGVPIPRPRPSEILDPSHAIYRKATGEFLAGRGIDDADADLVQIVRTDIEGDGRDEVVVVAERIADPGLFARAGDYSFVLLRRVVDDKVVTAVVTESVPDLTPGTTPFIQSHRISAIADLNGDGRMELALEVRQYEGIGMTVHELRPDGTMPAVMAADCGA